MNIVPLVYHVDCDKKYGRYIASIHPRVFKKLPLPAVIKDEFNSLAATYPWSYACQCKGNVSNIHMENYFFLEFQKIFRQHWDYMYGIPFIRFTGKTDTFSSIFCDQNIFLVTLTSKIDPLYQYTYWEEAWMKYREPGLLMFLDMANPKDEYKEIYMNVTSFSSRLIGYKSLRTKMFELIQKDTELCM